MFVLLGDGTSEANQPPSIGVPGDQSELIASLQDQVRYLREQLDAEREARTEERRRHDTIVAQLTSKIPALEAPPEPTEAAETVGEEPERAESHSATGGTQEGTERPQQRSGWQAPEDKLPWWHYVLGLFLVFSGVFLAGTLVEVLRPLAEREAKFVRVLIVVAVGGFPPGIFGLWVGYRKRNLRLWSQVLPLGALVWAVALLGVSLAAVGINIQIGMSVSDAFSLVFDPRSFLEVAVVVFPAWLLFVSASLLGNTWQRRHIGRISGTTPASPVSRTMQGAGQQPRKDLTPAQQAMLGWGGTIISALITLVGTIIAVRSGP